MTPDLVVDEHLFAGYRTRTLQTVADGPSPTMVMFHGYCDSADSWALTMQALAKHGIACVAVDLPGFGSADRLKPGPMLPQLRSFGTAVLEHFRKQAPIVLVGNSLGSITALLVAESRTDLAGLVITSEPTLGSSWLIDQFRAPRMAPLVRALAADLPLPRGVEGKLVERAVRKALYARGRRVDPAVIGRLRTEVRRRGHHRIVRDAWRLAQESVNCYRLDDVACPALVVHGRQDRIIPVGAAHSLHARLPTSKLVIHPAWGHCPQLDDPTGLAHLVSTFMAELA